MDDFNYFISMKIHQLFPSSVYQSKISLKTPRLDIKLKELVDELYKIKSIDKEGQEWSQKNYPGGYTSYSSMNQLHRFSTSFEVLQKQIDKEVKKFAKNLDLDLGSGSLFMTHFWANIMPPGVTHSMHIHPLSVISGSFYVQTPRNCSSIKFEDPRMVNFMASPPRKLDAHPSNQRYISIQPQAGEVVLFESWMRHEVPPNTAKSERISVSFNYEWCN